MKYNHFDCPAGWQESRPTRGGWIEIHLILPGLIQPVSRPTRGGWIEIPPLSDEEIKIAVPPHPGRVD